MTQVAVYCDGRARPGPAGRPGRPGLPRPGRGAGHRRLGGGPAAVRQHAALSVVLLAAGRDHDGRGHPDRAARAAAARAVPGADHADAGRCDHGGAGQHELPQRRRRLPRLQRRRGAYPADPPARHRGQRPGLLPLCGRGRRADVRAGGRAPAGPARPGLGGHPAERGGRAGRRDQHHAVQAVGVRAGLVHHRGGGRRAGRGRPLPVLDRLPDPGLDHAAGRGADGRGVQVVRRDRGRAAARAAARAAEQLGRVRATG